MANAQIVQACGCFHEGIGTVREGITKGILDTTGSFEARQSVCDSDADPRQGAIVPFVIRGQFVPAGLFFG